MNRNESKSLDRQTVSVAIATYNCGKYIDKQLKSIFAQTVLPNEIVICDDTLQEDSLVCIEQALRYVPNGIDVIVYKNTERLGFAKNFEKAISKCTSDIICLADQDDIWEKNKVSKILDCFENQPKTIMFFSDAFIIDSEDKIIGDSKNKSWDTRKNKADSLELTLLNIHRKGEPLGCTMAFRRDLYEKIKPFPVGYGHDEWISLCAPLFGDVCCSQDRLIRYRVHDSNTSVVHESLNYRMDNWDRQKWFTYADNVKNVFFTYRNRFDSLIDNRVNEELDMLIPFLQDLEDIIYKKRWGGIKLLKTFLSKKYQSFRGNLNTLIIDEIYLIKHIKDK